MGINLKLFPKNLLIIFIILQPVIGNINGATIDFLGFSLLGPLFYLVTFMFFFVIVLNDIKALVFTFFVVSYYILMLILGLMSLSNIPDFLKLILPVYIWIFVLRLNFNDDSNDTKKIFRALILSYVTYSIFILISFLVGYQKLEGHFTGFVFAGNDLIVAFLLGVLFFESLNIKFQKSYVVLIIGMILTFSKGLFLLLPVYALKIFKLPKKIIFSLGFILIAVIYFAINNLFYTIFGQFLTKADSFFEIFEIYSFDFLANIFTFGRYSFIERNISLESKNWYEFIVGSGIDKVFFLSDGKGGVEMDLLDAFNYYGLIGVSFLVFFYYLPVFNSQLGKRSKIFFLIVVFYSLLGGHFYNNPMSGTVYAIFLGLINNKSTKIYFS